MSQVEKFSLKIWGVLIVLFILVFFLVRYFLVQGKKIESIYPNGIEECETAQNSCKNSCSSTTNLESFKRCYDKCYRDQKLSQACYTDFQWGINE